MSDNNTNDTKQTPLVSMDEFAHLVRLANDGDDQALAQLRYILDECHEIWQQVGDLGKHAEMALIRLIANGNKLIAESLARKAAAMRLELGGPSPSPLEQLCVQRIVATWLELQWTDTIYPEPTGETLNIQKFVLKRKESAERRFGAAVKSLSLVRKLLPQGGGPKAKVDLWPQPEEIIAGVLGNDKTSNDGINDKPRSKDRRKKQDRQAVEELAEAVRDKWSPINRVTPYFELEPLSLN